MGPLYFFAIPFVSAFNVSQILILPLVIAMIALVWRVINGQLKRIAVLEFDKFVLAFMGTVLISAFANIAGLGPKNLSHLFAIFSGYLLFYFGAEQIARFMSIDQVLRVLYFSYLFATLFGLIEFGIVNFTSFNIGSIVFRPAIEEYTPGFLDIVLIRSRSLFEESGYYAAYLATIGPLVAYYLWFIDGDKIRKNIFIGLTVASYFVAFSVSLFIFLPFAVMATLFLKTVIEARVSKRLLLLYAILLLMVVGVLSSDFLMEVLFYRKLEGGSFEDRNQKFAVTLQVMATADWKNIFFGFGPGSYFNLGVKPAISVYLNYFRDLGLVGLVAYLAMTFYFLVDLFRDKSPLGMALFVSAAVIYLFYIATPIYFLPHAFVPMLIYRMRRVRARSDHESLMSLSGLGGIRRV